MRGTGTPPTKSAGDPAVPRIHVFVSQTKAWLTRTRSDTSGHDAVANARAR
jgi:hypothetical protein